jgi:hypothetical protein
VSVCTFVHFLRLVSTTPACVSAMPVNLCVYYVCSEQKFTLNSCKRESVSKETIANEGDGAGSYQHGLSVFAFVLPNGADLATLLLIVFPLPIIISCPSPRVIAPLYERDEREMSYLLAHFK